MANHQLIINQFPVIINLVAIARGVSGQRLNRQLIVNRFPEIVNPAALNPSKIYQSRAPIHQFASESFTLRNQIRNRPAKPAGENIRNYPQPAWPVSATAENYRVARRQAIFLFSESSDNHPMESANRPIIDRRNPRIDRSGQANKLHAQNFRR